MDGFVKKFGPVAGGLILATAFFLAYAFLPLSSPGRDSSPDENSNRLFSRLYAETGQLWLFEPLDQVYPGVVHPRSVILKDNLLLPGGFLGLPVIYGGLAKVVGSRFLPFMTALFAVFGLLGFWLAIRRHFGGRMAAMAAVLLGFQPVFWYEASRPFMPNVLFLSLLLLSVGFFFGRPVGDWSRSRYPSARTTSGLMP